MSSVSPRVRFPIKQVDKESAEILQRLHADAFSNYWNVADFNDFFATKGTYAWLAMSEDGRPAGMVVLRVQYEQSDIITIAVSHLFRRQGIAYALMEQATAFALEKDASVMFLDVEEHNHAAQKLYENLGFIQLSRRKLYYRQKNGSYTDALVMTRKLA